MTIQEIIQALLNHAAQSEDGLQTRCFDFQDTEITRVDLEENYSGVTVRFSSDS